MQMSRHGSGRSGSPPRRPSSNLRRETYFAFFTDAVRRGRLISTSGPDWAAGTVKKSGENGADRRLTGSIVRPFRSRLAAGPYLPLAPGWPMKHSRQRQRRNACQQFPADGGAVVVFLISSLIGFPPHQFFVMRTPNRRGSVRNTFVVNPLSSLFRKSPVIAVVSNTFLNSPSPASRRAGEDQREIDVSNSRVSCRKAGR